jgi:hypothetical protein
MPDSKLTFSCWFGWFLAFAQVSSGWAGSTEPARAKVHGLLANEFQAPISFEPNRGQTDGRVKFMARGSGYNFFLTPSNALFFLRQADSRDDLVPTDSDVFAMSVIGANPVSKITGQDELPSTSSYFLGSDPKKWHTNIPNFGKVQYEDIYPGIDLLYHGVKGQLEYDFVLHPGASPGTIAIEFAGVKSVHLSPQGELVLETARGPVYFHRPVAYQEDQGQRRRVKARYKQIQKHRVGFTIGVYDVSKTLVIDPVLAARHLADNNDRTPGREMNVPAGPNSGSQSWWYPRIWRQGFSTGGSHNSEVGRGSSDEERRDAPKCQRQVRVSDANPPHQGGRKTTISIYRRFSEDSNSDLQVVQIFPEGDSDDGTGSANAFRRCSLLADFGDCSNFARNHSSCKCWRAHRLPDGD